MYLFEGMIVLFQVLEWLLYANMVNYQASQDFDQLAIKKDEFWEYELLRVKQFLAFWAIWFFLEFIPFNITCINYKQDDLHCARNTRGLLLCNYTISIALMTLAFGYLISSLRSK